MLLCAVAGGPHSNKSSSLYPILVSLQEPLILQILNIMRQVSAISFPPRVSGCYLSKKASGTGLFFMNAM